MKKKPFINKKALKDFKLYDILLVALCILLSFVPLAIFVTKEISKTGTYKIALIKIDGKEVDRFEMDTIDYMEKTYHPSKGQYNIIEIKKGRIRNKEDNSPDQIAVRTGWISEVGQTAICIPHDFVIEIITNGEQKDEGYYIY